MRKGRVILANFHDDIVIVSADFTDIGEYIAE